MKIPPEVLVRLASMGSYNNRRSTGDNRAGNMAAQIGERRAAQMAWAADRRRYGW
jgi:hypothetical protein